MSTLTLREIPELDLVCPGLVSLEAPVENDAIQLGRMCVEGLHRTEIIVTAENEPRLITVRRDDSLPIQIEAHDPSRDVDTRVQTWPSRFLLHEPLGQITLRRLSVAGTEWNIDEVDIVPENQDHLIGFATIIGFYASKKQKQSTWRMYS